MNFKKDLKENIENKLIELNNQIEKINEKIDGLYNDVQELKNKNKNSSYDDEKWQVKTEKKRIKRLFRKQ